MLVGNLGQSELKCMTFRNSKADLVFGCNSGVISEFVSVGVYQSLSDAEENNLCNHKYFSQYDSGDKCHGLSDPGSNFR
jgi:hypothetical protein